MAKALLMGVALVAVLSASDREEQPEFLGRRETGLQEAFPRFVVDDEVQDVVALRGRILRVAPGILVEPSPVDEERVGRPAVRDETLENVTQDLLHGQIDAPVRREDQAILVLEAEDSLLHGTGRHHGRVKTEYTPVSRCSTDAADSEKIDLRGEELADFCDGQPSEFPTLPIAVQDRHFQPFGLQFLVGRLFQRRDAELHGGLQGRNLTGAFFF